MNAEQNVTRQDLANLETAVKQEIAAAESRFEGKLDAVEQRVYDHMTEFAERIETKLLTTFHGYTEEQHRRLQRVENAESLDNQRLVQLEERVRKLEERLDFPGQQPQ